MSTHRTIEERASDAAEVIGNRLDGEARSETAKQIYFVFADVVESDERVRELVAAAQKADNILTEHQLGAFIGLKAALAKFKL